MGFFRTSATGFRLWGLRLVLRLRAGAGAMGSQIPMTHDQVGRFLFNTQFNTIHHHAIILILINGHSLRRHCNVLTIL